MSKITIIGINNIPLIQPNDDLCKIICDCAEKQGVAIENSDIIIVTQKIISKAEGRIMRLKDIKPSVLAKILAKRTGKKPEIIEIIIREAKSIIKIYDCHIITETKQGFICANAGIDQSNVSGGDSITLLPENADLSAKKIRLGIKKLIGKKVAVIISDTFWRPFRNGHVDVAIGVSGMIPLLDIRGKKDIFGYVLKVKMTAIADELASAAELVIGNQNEGVPVAIIRGYKYSESKNSKATELIMPKEKNLFL